MKWLAILLLLLNVAYAGYRLNQSAGTQPAAYRALPARVPPDEHALKLLGELPLPPNARPANAAPTAVLQAQPAPAAPASAPEQPGEFELVATPAASNAAVPTVGGNLELPLLPELPAADVSATPAGGAAAVAAAHPTCKTIGAFADAAARDAFAGQIKNSAQSTHAREQSPAGARYWVYLPQDNEAAAQKALADLKAKGISDLFVINKPGLGYVISLGLFSAQSSVPPRVKKISAAGYQAQVEIRHKTAAQYWLDVIFPPPASGSNSPPALLPLAEGISARDVDCKKIARAGNNP